MTAEYVVRVILGGERPAGSEPLEVALWIDDREVASRISTRRAWAPSTTTGRTSRARPASSGCGCRRASTASRPRSCACTKAFPRATADRTRRVRPPPPPPVFKPPEGRDPREDREAPSRVREADSRRRSPSTRRGPRGFEVLGPLRAGARTRPRKACGRSTPAAMLGGGHGERCANDPDPPGPPRLPPPRHRRRTSIRSWSRGRGPQPRAIVRGGPGLALQAILVSPDFLFRIERGPPGRRRTAGPSPDRPRAGLAPLVLPLGQHARRRAPAPADRALLRRPEVLGCPGAAHAKDPKASALVEAFGGQWLQFRGPRVGGSRPRPLPRLRQRPAPGHAPRDRAVLREPPPRGPEHPRTSWTATTPS